MSLFSCRTSSWSRSFMPRSISSTLEVCCGRTSNPQAFGRPQVHTEARHRRFDGLQTYLERMTKLDGPERTATIKLVFCRNEMVVNFEFSTFAAGVTLVPFTCGVGHCSELTYSVLDVVRKTVGFKCFQGFLLYHSLRWY